MYVLVVGWVLVVLVAVIGWISNVVKFLECDFVAPFKAEMIHGFGIFIPPLGVIVGWLNFGT